MENEAVEEIIENEISADPKEKERQLKNYFTGSSFRLLVLWIGWIVLQIAYSLGAGVIAGKSPFVNRHYTEISMIASFIIDLLLFLMLRLAMKKNEQTVPERGKLSFGKWFKILLCGYTIAIVFNYIGFFANAAILSPFGYDMLDMNESAEMIASLSNLKGLIFEFIFIGILAPLMEELIFRKTVIDNFSKYGPGAAILVSSVMFGLFHGNFSQCFMAMALGAVFAYVYCFTGNIKYTIAMHMTVNIFNVISGMFSMVFINEETKEKVSEMIETYLETQDFTTYMNEFQSYFADKSGQLAALGINGVLMFIEGVIIFVGFITVLINIRKFFRFRKSVYMGEKGAKTYAMLNSGMVLCYICAAILFLLFYFVKILESPFVESLLR